MLPGWDDHLLPTGQAASATNTYVFSGALQGWRQPKFLRNLTNPSAQYAYRIPNETTNSEGIEVFNNDISAPSTWLEFADIDTTVVKSQVVNDAYQRYYFASPTQGPPTYNTLSRILANQPAFTLGVPAPACAPTVSVNGGGDNAQLGYILSNGGTTNIFGNTVYLIPIIPAGAMTVADVQWMPQITDINAQFAAVVYADAAEGSNVPTTPGVLLGTGAVVTGVTAGTLALSAFVNPPGLIQGSPYWIGIIVGSDNNLASTGDGQNASATFTATFTNGPPATAPAITRGQPDLQMFADLTTKNSYEARSYVYTYVSAYGEESPPSPYTLVNGWSNGTWSVGVFSPPTGDLGTTRNLAVIRIYRTVTGTSGSTVYFFVADISLGSSDPDAINFVATDVPACLPPAATYVDTQTDAVVALNLQMPSTNYFPPPDNLQGIVVLPNGMYVGWVDNQLWFSEPYYPHAWPPGTVYTTDFPIVGVGITAGSLVACTQANSWVFTGTTPTQMSQVKTAPPEPCTSRGSILSTDIGVFYISPNGLIQVTSGGTSSNATQLWITRERWAQLVPQKYTRTIPLASTYFCYGSAQNGDTSVAQQGFNVELDTDNTSFSIWPQPGGHRVGFNQLAAPIAAPVEGLFLDPWTAYGLIIQNGAIYYWDFTDPQPVMMPYDWTSKTYQSNTKKNYAAMRCFFQVPAGTPTPGIRNTAIPTDPSWNALGANQYAIIKVYADIQQEGANTGQFTLVTCREVQRSGELLRIAGGFKAENWAFEVLGRVPISNIQIATSVKELGNV